MPKRTDIRKILVIGSGPIQIGQACEFDYSGTQALKALQQEGYETVLVNSNPATIMTDPEFADRTYIEPLTADFLERIIAKEKPQALLPTVGGQTALNLAMELHRSGVLQRHGVELIGAKFEAIHRAEDRKAFKDCMERVGIRVPESALAHSMEEARGVVGRIGYPCVLRPAFTLGGSGGNIARTPEEFEQFAAWGLSMSPIRQILVEASVLGWKEYELEVMRDAADNVVIICSIENLDPMGVHTGDSITVAPQQTLSDREYQQMRDSSIRAIRAIGVDTGGCNIQFAVRPETGEQVIIEINPRVSRSSALASKATGFPIAKIAAKLALGYTLDELPNDITCKTPASFEPSIDYVVTKIPRFSFEKFPATPDTLTTQMKSVGEVMAIGRTFRESFQKALRSLEMDVSGLEGPPTFRQREWTLEELSKPRAERIWAIAEGLRRGMSPDQIHEQTKIDPWFLRQIRDLVNAEKEIAGADPEKIMRPATLRSLKEQGFSDARLAELLRMEEGEVRKARRRLGIIPVYKRVDTCAAEFEAFTPYLYSTYESEEECPPTAAKKKVLILGSGPNRIGQGIEFDYACVHAAMAFREAGFETLMVNCNPETVSTDYDISDRLYFEPLTLEDLLHIVEKEKPMGCVVQFGGQTPLKLALPLAREGVALLGTSAESIDRAEDRKQFLTLLDELGLKYPRTGMAHTVEEGLAIMRAIGFPVLLRPSYVLGGRAMSVVYHEKNAGVQLRKAFDVAAGRTVQIDHYLRGAIELDVDAVGDGNAIEIAGIMEHVEEAGIHSGDSSCCLPPHSIPDAILEEVRRQTIALGLALEIRGLMNIQFAILDGTVYVLEVNPRASRTVPFVSKATRVPWAKVAARAIAGEPLRKILKDYPRKAGMAVKSPVFPFIKFPEVDPILSAEMCSIGEVMGQGRDFAECFAKAQIATGVVWPRGPAHVFISVHDGDKRKALELARHLRSLEFDITATGGTHAFLKKHGIDSAPINKLQEGSPHVIEALEKGAIHLVINTCLEERQIADSYRIRRTSLEKGIPYFTNIHTAKAAIEALRWIKNHGEDWKI